MTMSTIVVIIYFMLIFNVTFGRILLYNTETDHTDEKFDCAYHVDDHGEEIPYCRRHADGEILNRTKLGCENEGELFSFRDLIMLNVLPSDVLDWNSSIEMADLYAYFFYNWPATENDDDYFLCKCIKRGTFGKYCEYQLTHYTESFSDAVEAQFEQKRSGDSWNTQRYGQILCYTTLQCDSGLLCLDWRDINDGTQRCALGVDEENWDKLEFNECEDDEFRCTNGMCIPEEFWLDGHVDCMDWSDELDRGFEKSCSFTPNAMECDEHICPRHSYSCGDGQCVDWITRMAFQRLVPADEDCYNKRNLNYMCEVSPHRRAWTLSNGLCWPDEGYDSPQFPPWNMMNASNLSNDEKCHYLFRCALSDGFELDCPCNRVNCSELMTNVCSDGFIVVYPSPGLISVNVLFYYNYNKSGNDLTVDGLILHGSHRCRGYQLTLKDFVRAPLSLTPMFYPRIDNILCTFNDDSVVFKNDSLTHQYDKFCYNDSFTFNGRPYAVDPIVCYGTGECISQYRMNDGFYDCLYGDDEYDVFETSYCTGKVGQHRFQCYNDQKKCLPVIHLGTGTTECSNNYDEIWYGRGFFLKQSITCQKNDTMDCDRLKEYIRQSSVKNESLFGHSQQQVSINQIPFRSYCDSFWDLHGHSDEWRSACQYWICQKDQYQCLSGQCIELDWVCDGEWDCSDASDEERIFLIENWSTHNARLNGLDSRLLRCRERYLNSPFSTICNTSFEFGCYLSRVSNPLDIIINRPCINLTQIGDGNEDCYNAYDEKNMLEANSNSNKMLGFHLRCGNHYEPYTSSCLPETKSNCTTILCLNDRSEDGSCSGTYDAMCLNGSCAGYGRCNGIADCLYGEDEYWCPSSSLTNQLEYRHDKKITYRQNFLHLIPQFPPQNRQVTRPDQFTKPIINPRNEYFSIMHSYQCNRGVAVLQMNETICLCPPAYYGRKCEFFSDRISIIAQIDQKTLPINTLRIKAKLLFDNKIVDEHEFIISPTMENLKKIKHKFYLLYSRSVQMLEHKRRRYFNRTDVINNHPYSVHFDAFSLEQNNSVKELGSWHYPIYFDYLPAYRLAVVLKFPIWFFNSTGDPCSQNVCNGNSICMPIFNQNHSYYCSCKSGFYGEDCRMYDSGCEAYCSVNALCRINADKLQPDTYKPSCICPLNRLGPRCNLKYNDCEANPCFNYGTCMPTGDQSGETSYICLCSKRFYGDRCQFELGSVHVNLNMTNTTAICATVVQLYDIEISSLKLLTQHQQVYRDMPTKIDYYHSAIHAPSLGLLKIYENSTYPQYFLMYSLLQTSVINITSFPQHCPHASLLLSSDVDKSIPSVFLYHRICHSDMQHFCFYDENYLCLCESDHYRAECFSHDTQLDHCSYCLADGKCVRGDLNDPNDFICICPLPYYGRRCEFNLNSFNTTIGSFPSSTSKAAPIDYTSVVFLVLIIAFLHNFSLFAYI